LNENSVLNSKIIIRRIRDRSRNYEYYNMENKIEKYFKIYEHLDIFYIQP